MTDQRTPPATDELWRTASLSPAHMDTFRRADGELIDDEFGWTTDLEVTGDNLERPQAFVQETWHRSHFRVFWLLPEVMGSCEIVMGDPDGTDDLCEEDAITWWQESPGNWLQVCSWHDPGEGTDVLVCQG